MKTTSYPCATENDIDVVEDCTIRSSSLDGESDSETVHHNLVKQWFRDRFFVPSPERPTFSPRSVEDAIIDGDFTAGRSMALFSDNLVSREIRSFIVPISDDEESYTEPKSSKPSRKEDSEDEFDGESLDGDEITLPGTPTTGLVIQRTFSFDEHLPIIHRRGTPVRWTSSIDEDDWSAKDDEFSFTIPEPRERKRSNLSEPALMS